MNRRSIELVATHFVWINDICSLGAYVGSGVGRIDESRDLLSKRFLLVGGINSVIVQCLQVVFLFLGEGGREVSVVNFLDKRSQVRTFLYKVNASW